MYRIGYFCKKKAQGRDACPPVLHAHSFNEDLYRHGDRPESKEVREKYKLSH